MRSKEDAIQELNRSISKTELVNESVSSFLKEFIVEKIGLRSPTYVVPLYWALIDRGFWVEVGHSKKTHYVALGKDLI